MDMHLTPYSSERSRCPLGSSIGVPARARFISVGTEGPCTSASNRPARKPSVAAHAHAKFAAVADLPTPPFPDATATIRCTPARDGGTAGGLNPPAPGGVPGRRSATGERRRARRSRARAKRATAPPRILKSRRHGTRSTTARRGVCVQTDETLRTRRLRLVADVGWFVRADDDAFHPIPSHTLRPPPSPLHARAHPHDPTPSPSSRRGLF